MAADEDDVPIPDKEPKKNSELVQFSGAALSRLMGGVSDVLTATNDTAKQNDKRVDDLNKRIDQLYDRYERQQQKIAEKDLEIADLKRTDADLRRREIEAATERDKLLARTRSTSDVIDMLKTLGHDLIQLQGGGRVYKEHDASYAEAMFVSFAQLLEAFQGNEQLFEQMRQTAPRQLVELAAVMKAYKDHRESKNGEGDNRR